MIISILPVGIRLFDLRQWWRVAELGHRWINASPQAAPRPAALSRPGVRHLRRAGPGGELRTQATKLVQAAHSSQSPHEEMGYVGTRMVRERYR